jgi:hypothetical protein
MSANWLGSPLLCDGDIVAKPLDTRNLTDADLWDICFRMHVILHTIEMPRCEERLLPIHLFDRMDSPLSLSDWTGLISEFEEFYGLGGRSPISVDAAIFRKTVNEYPWSTRK